MPFIWHKKASESIEALFDVEFFNDLLDQRIADHIGIGEFNEADARNILKLFGGDF